MTTMICEECRIGRCRAIKAPYVHWVGDRMAVLPNTPAYVCDVCKHMFYDPHFMRHLQYVFEHLAGNEPAPEAQRPSGVSKSAGWQSTRGSI
jgi:hypothetical protein